MTDLAGQPDWADELNEMSERAEEARRSNPVGSDRYQLGCDVRDLMLALDTRMQAFKDHFLLANDRGVEIDRLRATNAALEKERDEYKTVLEYARACLSTDWPDLAKLWKIAAEIRALTPTPAPQERQNG